MHTPTTTAWWLSWNPNLPGYSYTIGYIPACSIGPWHRVSLRNFIFTQAHVNVSIMLYDFDLTQQGNKGDFTSTEAMEGRAGGYNIFDASVCVVQ